jgi:hypothetical protein
MLKWKRGKAGSVRVLLPDLRERHTSPALLPMARVCSRQRESCWTRNPSMENRQMQSSPMKREPTWPQSQVVGQKASRSP